ncbi:MAG: hypothetical protein ACE5H4_11975 [Candidatus Thorarchaeota archaeon]
MSNVVVVVVVDVVVVVVVVAVVVVVGTPAPLVTPRTSVKHMARNRMDALFEESVLRILTSIQWYS